MATAKVRINFNVNELVNKRLMILKESYSKELGIDFTITDTLIKIINDSYDMLKK